MTEEELNKLKIKKIGRYWYCQIICSSCSKKDWKRKSDVRRRKNCFCSTECFSVFRRTGKDVECVNCSKKVYRQLRDIKKTKNMFCSRSCAAIHNNKHKICKKNCIQCGKECSKNAKKYCGSECQWEYIYKQYIAKWLNGQENGGICNEENVSKHIRKYLFEKHDHKCQKCGWNKVNKTTGRIPLTINHVDGNWKNNRPDNLELLCPNCHSLTHNYGSLNKGNGRNYRNTWRQKQKAIVV